MAINMGGIWKLETFINRYGEQLGTEKYNELCDKRNIRSKRIESNRSLAFLINEKLKVWTDKEKEDNVISGNLVKCKECGKYTTRLQWTHFKYKCTGRFKNGTEYKAEYPNEMVVAANLAKLTSMTKDAMVQLYGVNDGNLRWNKYCEKQRITNTLEYKSQEYGMTKDEFNHYNAKRAVTLENLIRRHGESVGREKWNKYCERQKYAGNSEKYFIEKLGSLKGKAKYKEVCAAKSHTIETYIKRYGNECIAREKLMEFFSAQNSRNSVSKIQIKFIEDITQYFPSNWEYVDGRDSEYTVIDKWNNKTRKYDLVITKPFKAVIEFDGDYWHCHPKKYDADYIHPHTNQTAQEIWDDDKHKQLLLENKGFEFYRVWESEYINNKNIISEILEWLKSLEQR